MLLEKPTSALQTRPNHQLKDSTYTRTDKVVGFLLSLTVKPTYLHYSIRLCGDTNTESVRHKKQINVEDRKLTSIATLDCIGFRLDCI